MAEESHAPYGAPPRKDDPDDESFAHIWRVAEAAQLPELVRGTTHGTRSLKVRARFLGRLKNKDTFAIFYPLEEKLLLIESVPTIYYDTDHHKGWPYVLIRLCAVSDEELAHRIKRAWRAKAPAKLLKMAGY